MKLENQLTSLELSKKLKELGVKQESAIYWVKKNGFKEYWLLPECSPVRDINYKYISAFTVSELGEMLPSELFMVDNDFRKDKEVWELYYYPSHGTEKHQYKVVYRNLNGVEFGESIADTEANARAKMLIYLLENKLINL